MAPAERVPLVLPEDVSDGTLQPVADLLQGLQGDVLLSHFHPLQGGITGAVLPAKRTSVVRAPNSPASWFAVVGVDESSFGLHVPSRRFCQTPLLPPPQDHSCSYIPPFQPTFYRNITVSGGPAPVRAYIAELLPDILEGRIQPGRVFDRTIGLKEVPDGYRAMDERKSIKVMVNP